MGVSNDSKYVLNKNTIPGIVWPKSNESNEEDIVQAALIAVRRAKPGRATRKIFCQMAVNHIHLGTVFMSDLTCLSLSHRTRTSDESGTRNYVDRKLKL